METPETSINAIDCPAADQLADVIANLRQAQFLIAIHEMRLRSAAYEREKKRRQRARRHPIERARPTADTVDRIAS